MISDRYTQFLEQMGIRYETQNKDYQKLKFKYQALNQKTQPIQFHESIYSMGLQRSNYLQIDCEKVYHLH